MCLAGKGSIVKFPKTIYDVPFSSRLRAKMVVACLWSGLLVVAGCDGRDPRGVPVSPNSTQSTLPLLPSEDKLKLDQVAPGGQKQCAFRLMNRSATPVAIAEVETSCDCLKIDLPQRLVPPGEEVSGRALLDLRNDPYFTGQLRISVKGRSKSGKMVFALGVEVTAERE